MSYQPYQYPGSQYQYQYPVLTREKVAQEVKTELQHDEIAVTEARRCSANVEVMKGYVYYFQPHELTNVQAVLQSFIEQECKPRKIKSMYLWSTREGNQSRLDVGFFEKIGKENEPTILTMLSVVTVP
jgi:hypothetical protein